MLVWVRLLKKNKNTHNGSGTDILKISVSIYQAFTVCQALGQVLLLCMWSLLLIINLQECYISALQIRKLKLRKVG